MLFYCLWDRLLGLIDGRVGFAKLIIVPNTTTIECSGRGFID